MAFRTIQKIEDYRVQYNNADREYRVKKWFCNDADAYYCTDDKQDAISKAQAMHKSDTGVDMEAKPVELVTRAGIRTRWHGPTNTKGSRITAKSQAGQITVPYDHAHSVAMNHQLAAQALADKFGWGEVVTGCGFDNDYYWAAE